MGEGEGRRRRRRKGQERICFSLFFFFFFFFIIRWFAFFLVPPKSLDGCSPGRIGLVTGALIIIEIERRRRRKKTLFCFFLFFLAPSLSLFFFISLSLSLTSTFFFLSLSLSLFLSLSLSPYPLLHNQQQQHKGALDGYTDDPTYPLFKRGACGAAFEGDEAILELLEENLAPFRRHGVAIMKEYAHPSTMPARLKAAGITVENLDVLKVDVDGFDLALARSVLEAGFRPKVVLMESNTDVPAPFTYETAYRHDYGVYFQCVF